MREVKIKNLERQEHYLVFVGYEWSPSGYDIAFFDGKTLDSQTTLQDLISQPNIKIYQLPNQ